ncbi:MAG: DMT family protein [Phycisphaerae bacterium]
MGPWIRTIGLLVASNVFMTGAWYGHLKYKSQMLWKVVLVSWAIAFFEYCLQVPANRWAHRDGIPAATLKVLQEAITMLVFAAFALLYLRETPRWNQWLAFGLVIAAVALASWPFQSATNRPPA